MNEPSSPQLSVVVIAHNMRRQAMNTLYSLCADYQHHVSESRYEVIVVENDSADMLNPDEVAALGSNFHYLSRNETGVSPAAAINHALSLCRGQQIGLMIDGARMLTPGVIHAALGALSQNDGLVVVPAYYLTEAGRSEGDPDSILALESELLDRLHWKQDGYQLFTEACFSNGNRHGYMEPIMECTALFCDAWRLQAIGGADEAFDLPGGGALNLHLFRRLATQGDCTMYVLPGEGNFHQFHGGTSTTAGPERDALVRRFKEQLDSYWPGGFKGVSREPVLFGSVGRHALPFLTQSAESAKLRLDRFAERNKNPWPDERTDTATA